MNNNQDNDNNNNNPRAISEISSSDNNGGSGSSNLDSDERNSSNSSGSASGSAGEEDRASNEDSEGGSSSVVSDAEEDDAEGEEDSSDRKRKREKSDRPKPPPVAVAARANRSTEDNTDLDAASTRKDGRKYVEKNSLDEQQLLQQRDEIRARIKNKETSQLTEEEIAEDRRAANRLSAYQSRKRRKMIIEDLQKTVADLTRHRDFQNEEIGSLRSDLVVLKDENRTLRHELEMRKRFSGSDIHHTGMLPASLSGQQDCIISQANMAPAPSAVQSSPAVSETYNQYPTQTQPEGPHTDLGSYALLSAAAMLLGSAQTDASNPNRREETLDLLQEFLDVQRQISRVEQAHRNQHQEQSYQSAPTWSQPPSQAAPLQGQSFYRHQDSIASVPRQEIMAQQQAPFSTGSAPSNFTYPPTQANQQVPQAQPVPPPSSVFSSTVNVASPPPVANADNSQLLDQIRLLLQGGTLPGANARP